MLILILKAVWLKQSPLEIQMYYKVFAILHENSTWVKQPLQIDLMEALHNLLNHQPTKHSQKPKNARFVITLNVLINVDNHPNFQWLKVRQTTYWNKAIWTCLFLLLKLARYGLNILSIDTYYFLNVNKNLLLPKKIMRTTLSL